jgi:acetylcholinesterase
MLGHPDTAPFKAVILESGAPGGVPIFDPSAKDAQYQRVLRSANCTSADDQLSCLRSVPWRALRTISLAESSRAMTAGTYQLGNYAWTGTIDGGSAQGGFFSSRPSLMINQGTFARVPVLHGDCLDEGTYFAPHTFNNTASLANWLGGKRESSSSFCPDYIGR